MFAFFSMIKESKKSGVYMYFTSILGSFIEISIFSDSLKTEFFIFNSINENSIGKVSTLIC